MHTAIQDLVAALEACLPFVQDHYRRSTEGAPALALARHALDQIASTPLPVPEHVLKEIVASEAKRLNISEENTPVKFAAYFTRFSTSCPGYTGPLVVVCWEVSPGALSSFIMERGKWVHCNSASW